MVVRYSISLSEDLSKRLDFFLSKHKKEYQTDSAFFQELTENFLNPGSKQYFGIAMLYFGYPVILLTILLKAYIDTGDGFYNTISMLILGFLIAGVYWFYSKNKGNLKGKKLRLRKEVKNGQH